MTPKIRERKNLAVIVRRVREVSRSIRTGLRIGSRRAEVGSTINKVLPVRGAQDQTNVWAKSPCSSLDGGAAGAASRPLHFLHHIRKGEERNHLRRPHSSGRGDTERIRRTKRRRWRSVRYPVQSYKHLDGSLPVDTCPIKNEFYKPFSNSNI